MFSELFPMTIIIANPITFVLIWNYFGFIAFIVTFILYLTVIAMYEQREDDKYKCDITRDWNTLMRQRTLCEEEHDITEYVNCKVFYAYNSDNQCCLIVRFSEFKQAICELMISARTKYRTLDMSDGKKYPYLKLIAGNYELNPHELQRIVLMNPVEGDAYDWVRHLIKVLNLEDKFDDVRPTTFECWDQFNLNYDNNKK